ncbi:LuxR family transcriptional regulator [Streptomyces sp. MP131-18]|uniref:helix-turn-helix transcriptional regulator n=1 Tax=Streptomyces sp. MP131-18 TaxID=1857892 RepID=UPI0009CE0AB0|nr:LuxR family transcriptional regulator [Streptomyces sp. MP131-18]ONK11277.1 TOMM system kinase/cyclase fusion protein [Streptomyces sp. MP131-18]
MVLVQREEEFMQVRMTFDDCRGKRRGHAVLISGAVGSGKTSLLESLNEYFTEEGGRVLRAVGSQSERDIPLGVIGQLLHGASFPEKTRRLVEGLLPEHAPAAPAIRGQGAGPRPSLEGRHQAAVLHRLFTSLSELARSGPLVLALDDVQHADSASLHCLLYVIRRLRHAPMMVLMTEAPMLRLPHPHFRAELLSQPYFSRIALQPLTRDSLTRLVGRSLDPSVARKMAERARAITGGSPLLAQALVDDPLAQLTEPEYATPPGGGGPFDQAVLGCLYRHEPEVRQVAQALAVLGRKTSVDILDQVLDITHESAVRAVHILRISGLVEGNELRHPRITRSVLGDLSAESRRSLHSRAAEALHNHGAEPTVVADHLVAADWAEDAWAVPVLQEAAAHALSLGRPEFAGACLRQAWRAETDESQRADIKALLVKARWQVNPLSAEAHLPDLLDTIRQRGASVPGAVAAVPSLLWQGRSGEAGHLLAQFELDDERDTAAAAELRVMHMLVSLCRPESLTDAHSTSDAYGGPARNPVVSPHLEALTVLHKALFPTPDYDVVARAEQIIRRHNSEVGAPGLLAGPLLGMLYVGRSDRVAAWTDTLLHHSTVRHAPIWQAILEGIRAEALLRLGDLRGSEQHARSALESITPQAWGVAVAGPLGTLITCATEAGRHHEADTWLAYPTPASMFQTPLGLHYLVARGRYHLAAGRPHAARDDLQQCAELMEKWRLDLAGLVAWRLELAQVHLALDNRAEAARLLHEETSGERRVDDRTRGRALRLMSRTAVSDRKKRLLSEAVDVLQASGDKVELARALSDLGHALHRSGDSGRPHMLIRRAYQLALESGAESLADRLMRSGSAEGLVAQQEVPQGGHGLSEAELRVAALATLGDTNRQISNKLFITVSTVEQHLTRVYRKLGVKRRVDLPAELVAYAEETRDASSEAV